MQNNQILQSQLKEKKKIGEEMKIKKKTEKKSTSKLQFREKWAKK